MGYIFPLSESQFRIWCEVETLNISLADIQVSDQVRDTKNLSYSQTIFHTGMKLDQRQM